MIFVIVVQKGMFAVRSSYRPCVVKTDSTFPSYTNTQPCPGPTISFEAFLISSPFSVQRSNTASGEGLVHSITERSWLLTPPNSDMGIAPSWFGYSLAQFYGQPYLPRFMLNTRIY